jgi:hypothetical protein
MILQLNPYIPMYVVDKGKGHAIAVIDYSQEHSLLWVIAMDDIGEIWTVPNEKVRMQWNESMQRIKDDNTCTNKGFIPIMED